jgi:hypothetical protein
VATIGNSNLGSEWRLGRGPMVSVRSRALALTVAGPATLATAATLVIAAVDRVEGAVPVPA